MGISLDQSQAEIQKVCQEMSEFLLKKNVSYDNSFTKDITYGGTVIPAIQTINVRITDKLRRLQSGGSYVGDNDEEDLLGYLILKKVLKNIQSTVASV